MRRGLSDGSGGTAGGGREGGEGGKGPEEKELLQQKAEVKNFSCRFSSGTFFTITVDPKRIDIKF
jgi:hypothetical protein